MNLLNYLREHTIVSIGKSVDDECVIVEMISDNPKQVIKKILDNDCYISEIRWWDRALLSKKSKIGYGGTCDPREPKKYYFAETDICNSFGPQTTLFEYINYLDNVKASYSEYDIYPAFDVYRK